MVNINKTVAFCHCGRTLKNLICPIHKTFIKKPVRVKIGRWSGRSGNKVYGLNWGER